MALSGMAWTKSRSVIPGFIFPWNFTSTDSGISSGITPVAAANAIRLVLPARLSFSVTRLWGSPTQDRSIINM